MLCLSQIIVQRTLFYSTTSVVFFSALALQDLLDMETVDEIEWSSCSENEDSGRDDDDDMMFD